MIARAGTERMHERYQKAATDVVKWISLKAADITRAKKFCQRKKS